MKLFFIDANNTTAQVNYPLLEEFMQMGLDVTYITSFNRWDSDYYESNYDVNSRWFFFNFPNKVGNQRLRQVLKGATYFIDIMKLFFFILFNRPEIIHVNNIVIAPITYYFLKLLRIIKLKIILTQHNYKEHDKTTVSLYKSKCFYEFDKIICLSVFTKNEFPKIFHNKINVLPHGNVYNKEIRKYAHDFNNATHRSGSINLLFFGIIRPYKGIELLIDAVCSLEKKIQKDINLRIIGNALNNNYLQTLKSRTNSNTNIQITHKFLDYKEIINEIMMATIGVLPYLNATQSGIPYLYAGLYTPLVNYKCRRIT
jgi:glycosyltransferase involved in cell wall biosynthesis